MAAAEQSPEHNKLVADIVERVGRLRTARSGFEAHWSEIQRFVFPDASPTSDRKVNPGEKTHAEVLDNTAEMAASMLAAAVHDALTPDSVDWFQLRVTDDESLNQDYDVALWLEDSGARMLNVFRSPSAGYALAAHEMRVDDVTLGTGGMAVLERPGDGIVFVSVPLGQLILDDDDLGRVRGVFRDFTMTARDLWSNYGEAAGEDVKRAATSTATSQREREYRVIHAVMPRRDRDPAKAAVDSRHKKFASLIVLPELKLLVEEKGFDENPYITPRWTKRAGEIYGRGCGMTALSDVKMLQRSAKVNIGGAELSMRPPMLVADDGVMGPVRMTTGGLNHVRSDLMASGNMPIRPMLTGSRPDIGEDLMAAIRARIDNAFMKPLIQLVRKDRMTATEVLEVMAQNQRILSPFLGRLKMEDVGPTIERVFGIMLRNNAFLPMPPQLVNRDIGVEYVSPMVKRQRLTQAQGLAQYLEVMAPIAAVYPAVYDNVNFDVASRDTADIMGLHLDWLRHPNERDAMRKERQDAQAQETQRQATLQGVDTMANAARAIPALSQALNSPTEALGVV